MSEWGHGANTNKEDTRQDDTKWGKWPTKKEEDSNDWGSGGGSWKSGGWNNQKDKWGSWDNGWKKENDWNTKKEDKGESDSNYGYKRASWNDWNQNSKRPKWDEAEKKEPGKLWGQTDDRIARTPPTVGIPATPRDAFTIGPGTPGFPPYQNVPGTPRDAFQQRQMPGTPRDAYVQSVGPTVQSMPGTPADAFAGVNTAPGTPGLPAYQGVPGTPRDAFAAVAPAPGTARPPGVPLDIPSTPAEVGGRIGIPATPRDAFDFSPFTPGMTPAPGIPGTMTPNVGMTLQTVARQSYAPGTPGLPPLGPAAAPGTPGGAAIGQRGNPATPAGVPGTPGYGYAGAVVPGTPGARRASAVPFTPNAIMGHSGLSTPGYGQRQLQLQQQQQQQQAAERMKKRPAVPTFSDGTSAPLRHAPRRQKGTGEKLPAPSTPAPVPQHWSNPPPATPAPAAPEEPVPTFDKWRRIHKNDVVWMSRKPAPPVDLSAGAAPQTPGLPMLAPVVQAPDEGLQEAPTPMDFVKEEAPTPMHPLSGQETPVLAPAGATGTMPVAPQAIGYGYKELPPSMAGETPLLYPRAGEETPHVSQLLPRYPAGSEDPKHEGPKYEDSKDEGTPAMSGAGSVPVCPTRPGHFDDDTALFPLSAPLQDTPHLQPGGAQEFIPGMETPLLGGMTPHLQACASGNATGTGSDMGGMTPNVQAPSELGQSHDGGMTPFLAGQQSTRSMVPGMDTPMLPPQTSETPLAPDPGDQTPWMPAPEPEPHGHKSQNPQIGGMTPLLPHQTPSQEATPGMTPLLPQDWQTPGLSHGMTPLLPQHHPSGVAGGETPLLAPQY